MYKEGIIDNEHCGIKLNHAILLVGYDKSDSEKPFWTVKNSWGTGWGMGGYAHIAISPGKGVCGINMDPSYPTD